MGKSIKKACLYLVAMLLMAATFAQTEAPNTTIFSTDDPNTPSDSINLFTVRNIIISGNKKTNPDIILRELDFQVGEHYPLDQITTRFQRARKNLMNTGLFLNVVVSLKSMSGYEVYVSVHVEEKWYIWPKPFVRTVDRSFGVWWKDQDRNLNRINYGLSLSHNNFTGNNDRLKINFMSGYTRQLSLQYYGLFLDNALKWSVNGGVAFGKNREVNYMTRGNKLVPVKDPDHYLRTYMSWFAQLNYRPAIKTKHTLSIGYSYEEVADTVVKLNPDFSEGRNIIRQPEISYRMSYFDVDFIPYPTRGNIADITIRKKGFNDPLNLWQLTVRASHIWPLTPKYFFSVSGVGMLKLPLKQPYVTNQFIGYEDQYLQGYEYYVIDGVAGGYTKATLNRSLLNTAVRLPTTRFNQTRSMPIKIYAKAFTNAGYVYCPSSRNNVLTNTFIYSGGIGLDVVLFADFVVKLEWSFNRLGENGLYLHRRSYF